MPNVYFSSRSKSRIASFATILACTLFGFQSAQAQLSMSVSGNTSLCAGDSTEITVSATCDYTLQMFDSFGDGWNGATFNVLSGGDVITSSTFTTGNSATDILSLPIGDSIEVVFTSGGFPNEESFIFMGPAGDTLVADGPAPTNGTIYTGYVDCGFTAPITFQWNPTTGVSDPAAKTTWITPAATTTYTLSVLDSALNLIDTISTHITVGASYTLSLSASPTSVCLNEDVALSVANVGGNGPFAYTWSGGGVYDNDTSSTPIVAPNQSGTVFFGVEAISSDGCTIVDSVSATVSSNPVPSAFVFGDTSVCAGDSNMIEVTTGDSFMDDFNSGVSPDWATVTGTANMDCGAMSGDALHFNNAGVREAQTPDMNVVGGGSIDFALVFGSGGAPCETADLNENVVLEYSTNGGANWTIITTYVSGTVTTFTAFNEPIPAGAQTTATRFRWRQTQHSGLNFDNWAIDDVSIVSGGTGLSYAWSPTTGVSDPTSSTPFVGPSTTTNYTVIVTDTAAGCADTVAITVAVAANFTYAATIADTSLCFNEPVQLNVTPTPAGSYTYLWSGLATYDDSTLADPMGSPQDSGTVWFYYDISSAAGCDKSDSISASVVGPTVPIISITGDASLCLGDSNLISIDLDPTQSEGDYTVSWSPTAGLADPSAYQTLASPAANTTYVATVTEPTAGCSATDSIALTVVPDFTYTVAVSDSLLCLGEGFQATVTPTPAGSYSYNWSPSGIADNDTIANPVITFSNSGSNTAYFDIESALGCGKSDSIVLNVSATPQPIISIVGDSTMCIGDSVELSVENAAVSVVWSDDFEGGTQQPWTLSNASVSSNCGAGSGSDALFFNGTNPRTASTTAFDFSGGGSVSFWIINGSGAPCETPDANEWLELFYSTDGGANWTLINSYTNGSFPNWTPITETIPAGAMASNVMLLWQQTNSSGNNFDNWAIDDVSISAAGSLGYTFSWSPAASAGSPSSPTTMVSPAVNTTYTVIAADSAGGCADTASFNVNLVPDFTYVVTQSDDSVCINEEVQVNITPTPAGAYDYTWTTSGAIDSDTIANPIISWPIGDTTIFAQVEIASALGCNKVANVGVTISGGYIPWLAITGDTSVCAGDSNAIEVQAVSPEFTCDFTLDMFDSFGDGWNGADIEVFSNGNSVGVFTASGTGSTATATVQYGSTVDFLYSPGTFEGEVTYDIYDSFGTLVFSDGPNPATGIVFTTTAACNVPAAGNYTYAWTPVTGIDDPTSATIMAGPTVNSTYTVVVTDTANNCVSSDSVMMTIAPNFTYTQTQSDTGVCLGEMVNFSVTPSAGTYTYSWTPAAIMDDSTIANPTGTMDDPGTNTISVLVDGGLGCEKTIDFTVGVSSSITPDITVVGDTTVCDSGSTQLVVINNAAGGGWNDNFDGGAQQPWVLSSASVDASCGSNSGADALFFDGTNPRTATTTGLTIGGGDITFWIINGSGGACETPDANEDLVLQYSTNGGTNWTVINTYTAGAFNAWTFITEPIPAGANGTGVLFQFIQNNSSGAGFDNWAIDDVTIPEFINATYLYSWTPTVGINDPTASTIIVTPTADTTYTVVIIDSVGGCSDTASIGVTLVPGFTYTATASDTGVCLNETVQFDLVVSPAGSYTYSWEPGAIMSDSTISNPVGTMSDAGNISVVYTADNGLGCEQTDSLLIGVSGSPTPIVSILGDSTVCAGDSTQLTVFNATAGESFIDNFNGGTQANWTLSNASVSTNCGANSGADALFFDGTTPRTATTPALNAVAGGTISFWIIHGTGGACELPDAGEVLVLQYSTNGGANWTTIATYTNGAYPNWTPITETIPAAAQTQNTMFQFIQSTASGAGFDNWAIDDVNINTGSNAVYLYSWSPTAGLSNPTGASTWVTPTTDTTYSVVVIDSVGGCSDSTSINLYAVPNFTYTVSAADSQLCLLESTQLDATASPAGTYNFAWTPPYFLDDTAIANPVATFDTAGTKTIYITIDNSLGCEKYDSLQFAVSSGVQPDVDIFNDTVVCLGDTVQMGIFVGPPLTCDFTLDMFDSFGDGWNGASLEVQVNGISVGNFTATGFGSTGSFSVTTGDEFQLIYTSGAFDNEVTYDVLDPDGNVVFSDGPNPTLGLAYTGVANCNGDNSNYSFSWGPSTGVSDVSAGEPTIAPLNDTTYTLITTDTIGGCADTTMWTVNVVPGFNLSVTPELTGICLGLDVDLAATLTPAGTYTYSWADPNGLLDNDTSLTPTATMNIPGLTSFVFTADNGQGCVKTDSAMVNTSTAPAPVLSSPGALFYCIGDTAVPGIELIPNQDVTCFLTLDMFDAAGNGWDSAKVDVFINNILVDSTTVPLNLSYAQYQIPFAYGDEVTLIYTPGNVESENSFTLTDVAGNVIYAGGPTPTTGVFYDDTPVCTDAGLYTIDWTPTTGINDTSLIDVFVPNAFDTTYTLIVTDTVGGCSDTASVTISVTGPLDATITTAAAFCENEDNVAFTAVDLGGSWTLDGNAVLDSISIDSLSLGMHTLIYSIPGSCGDIDTLDFDINPTPATPSFAADTACEGQSITLQPGTGGTTEWFSDAGLTNSLGAAPVNVTASGSATYYAVVTNTDGCESDAGTQDVEAYAAPNPGAISGPTTVETLESYNYSVTNDPNWTYTWFISNGNITSGFGTSNITVLWGAVGTGQVNLIVTNENNCESDTIVLPVQVDPVGIFDGFNSDNFSVQPNPFRTNTRIVFENPNHATYTMELFDHTGRIVRRIDNVTTEQVTLDRGNLAAGVYHLRLTGPKVYTTRLVIEK